MAVHNLFYVHGDVYNDYYIKTNVQYLRDHYGFEKGEVPEPKELPPDRPYVMNPK
jgi:hypothetical protein